MRYQSLKGSCVVETYNIKQYNRIANFETLTGVRLFKILGGVKISPQLNSLPTCFVAVFLVT